MERLRCIWKHVLRPAWAIKVLIPCASFFALAIVFASGQTRGAVAYCIYAFSAYSLVILIIWVPRLAKSFKQRVRQAVARNVAVSRLMERDMFKRFFGDLAFRGGIGICLSTAVNFVNVVFRVVTGVLYASPWFISMAVYYLVLGVLRASLAYCYRVRNDTLEARCYRLTARALFLLDIPMGGMIILMVFTDSGFTYSGCVIYLSALYAFYAMGLSVANLFRYRRVGSPILSAAKVLSFVSAMMSLLGLQTAMIAQFSNHDEGFRVMMNAITGGFVYAITIGVAIYMLVRARTIKGSIDLG